MKKRTPARKKALELAEYLRKEILDYDYLKQIFRYLRDILEIKVTVEAKEKKEVYIPTEEEIQKYYQAVWESNNTQNMIIIKSLLYTGIRVGELIRIKLEDVDLAKSEIIIKSTRIGGTDRIVPIPSVFREVLAMHIKMSTNKSAEYLFESTWKKPYTDRGIRKITTQYSKIAGIKANISPRVLRNFLFTWMKKNNIEDALIQPYSGYKNIESLEKYNKLATFSEAKEEYEKVIRKFPV